MRCGAKLGASGAVIFFVCIFFNYCLYDFFVFCQNYFRKAGQKRGI